jgi:hypothetical protein
MPESYSSGTTPFPTDPRRVRWQKMLIKWRSLGGSAAEDPHPSNSLRQIKVKILNVLNAL